MRTGITTPRTTITAMLFTAALITVALLAGAPAAHAQPCDAIAATNLTDCELGLCVYDALGNQTCITLGPAGSPNSTGFISHFDPTGVISAAKKHYDFTGNPFCTPCIRIPGVHVVLGCCAQVCYDSIACTITISPCGPTCLP